MLDGALRALQQGRRDEAAGFCRQVLALAPGQPDALSFLGIIAAQQNDLPGAIELLRQARSGRPDDPQIAFNLAHLLDETGQAGEAESQYRNVIQLDPGALPAWMNLGALKLRQDLPAEAAPLFRRAAGLDPRNADALLGLGLALQKQQQLDEAASVWRHARALQARPDILTNLGGLLLDLGQFEEGEACLAEAVRQQPGNPDLLTALGVAHFYRRNLPAAKGALDESLRLQPGHSRALAMQTMVLGDLGETERLATLLDFDRLLRAYQMPVPPGHADLAAFNRALAAHAENHPTLLAARAGKTTRGGSQTGELLQEPRGPVALLEQFIRQCIEDYRKTQPLVPGHPFLGQRPARYRLTAWATVLYEQGHQDTHNHPSGWLSGVYYAQIPPSLNPQDDQAGWIEFGRADPGFRSQADLPVRLIQPRAGALHLFPSYMWHRTVPFTGEAPRISIAFDAMPA